MKILNKSLINKEIYYYVPLENIRKFDENLQKDILYVLHFMGVKKLWFKMETEDEPISFAYEIIDFFEKKRF